MRRDPLILFLFSELLSENGNSERYAASFFLNSSIMLNFVAPNPSHMYKATRYIMMMAFLTLLALTGCEDNPFVKKEPESVREGLPGVWESSRYTISESRFRVRDAETGEWHEIIRPEVEFPVEKNSDYYVILKFTDENIQPLGGGVVFEAALTKFYPYTLEEDSVIVSSFLPRRFEESVWEIQDMKSGSFILVNRDKGPEQNGEQLDTICLKRECRINFTRLR